MTVQSPAEVERTAQSKNEVNYGLALLELGLPFDMQFQVGMPGMRGSQRIDFVVYIAPRSAAVFIQGSYWHGTRNATEDQLKQDAAEQAGFWVVLVSEEESSTIEAAKAHIRRNLL